MAFDLLLALAHAALLAAAPPPPTLSAAPPAPRAPSAAADAGVARTVAGARGRSADGGTASASSAPPADFPPCPSEVEAPEPARLVRRLEYERQGEASVSLMRMDIKTKSWARALTMKVWSKGRDYALVRVVEGGPRETGMMTLKRERQLWNYLPQAGRVMKLPSGMLGDSWMGSDLTNDDLLHGNSLSRDFDVQLRGPVEHEGRAAWRLELVPKPSAAIVWGKIELVVERASCVPLLERFFDDDGKLARVIRYGELRDIGWRRVPMRMTVKPEGQERETVINYRELDFEAAVPDETFSLHRLQQGR